MLMDDVQNRGVYRTIPVSILGAAHTPPQPYLVPIQMEQLILTYDRMREEQHILSAIAAFHLQFEHIHPFIDGNGRTGRLVLNLELVKAGYLPVNIKFADRREYYSCFDEYAEKGTITKLEQLVARYETEELQRYISMLEQ